MKTQIIPQKLTFLQELFKQRTLPKYQPTEQQQQFAKKSLIYKKKLNSNIHSILFCKPIISQSQLSNQNQIKILQEEKSKYLTYIKKTYKQKIPEDFQSIKKIKSTIRKIVFERKENQKDKDQVVRKRPTGLSASKKNEAQQSKKVKNSLLLKEKVEIDSKNKKNLKQIKGHTIELQKLAAYKQVDQFINIQEDNHQQNYEQQSDINLNNDILDDPSYMNDDEQV